MRDTYYRQHRHRTLAEILADPQDAGETTGKTGIDYFKWKVVNCGMPLTSRLLDYTVTTSVYYTTYNLDAMYYLILSKYCNNSIASSDENRFWMELTSVLFQHGPEWQRLTKLQDDLLNLTNDQLVEGSIVINNYAEHPDSEPQTVSDESLGYITHQNATVYKKDKFSGYTRILPWMRMDTTNIFLKYFKNLFTIFAYDYKPLLYEQESDT